MLLDAAEDARAQIKQRSLDSLTPHQRVVYEVVREHGPVGPSEIHERYTEEADDPRTKRTVRTYLSKMAQYNLLEAEERVGTGSIPLLIRQQHRRWSDSSVVSYPQQHSLNPIVRSPVAREPANRCSRGVVFHVGLS